MNTLLGVLLLLALGAVLAGFCWRMSRLHREISLNMRCIADMLDAKHDPVRVEQIAEAHRQDLIAQGMWKS